MKSATVETKVFVSVLQKLLISTDNDALNPVSKNFLFQEDKIIADNAVLETVSTSPLHINSPFYVNARNMFQVVSKCPKDTLKLTVFDDKLRVSSGRFRSDIPFTESDNFLGYQIVTHANTNNMHPVNIKMLEALKVCCPIAAAVQRIAALTSVHIHPDYVEASDTWQIVRYKLNTWLTKSILVPGKYLSRILKFNLTHFEVQDKRIRFLSTDNDYQTVISCLFNPTSKEFNSFIEQGFKTVTAKPKNNLIDISKVKENVVKAIQRVSVFAKKNKQDHKLLKVETLGNMLTLSTDSAKGSAIETVKLPNKVPTNYFITDARFLSNAVKVTDKISIQNNCVCLFSKNKYYILTIQK